MHISWKPLFDQYKFNLSELYEKQVYPPQELVFRIFDLDVQGTDSMKAYFKDRAQVIFISPPSVEELEKRLRHRGTENTQVINLRLMNAQKELLRKNDFDFLIYNDDIENAYKRLFEITQSILSR